MFCYESNITLNQYTLFTFILSLTLIYTVAVIAFSKYIPKSNRLKNLKRSAFSEICQILTTTLVINIYMQ